LALKPDQEFYSTQINLIRSPTAHIYT